jgi:hypothetical protein
MRRNDMRPKLNEQTIVAFIDWLAAEKHIYLKQPDLEGGCEHCGGNSYDDVYETSEQLAEEFLKWSRRTD